MPPPILDFHTHAQNVFGCCAVPHVLRPLARRGLARVFEATGFDPRMKRAESKVTTHLAAWEMQARFATFTFADYLAAMRKNRVTHACALPIEPMARTEDLLRLVAAHPEVIPFASVDFESGDEPAKQLSRHLAAGCRGLKLHPIMQNVAPEDERVTSIFESLRGTDVPVIFHTGTMHYFLGARPESPDFAAPERFLPLLRRFPKHPVVFGHMGLLDGAEQAIRVAEEFDNVWLEVSFQPASIVRDALRRVGKTRLLLGSDWPASEARSEIAVLRKAAPGDADVERRVVFENGAELLRRAGAPL
jgi:uncharacterized protein